MKAGPGLYVILAALCVNLVPAANAGETSPLVNISTRSMVEIGAEIQIAGFVLGGNAPRIVLVRAGGPALKELGVAGVLEDPVLRLMRGSTEIAVNDDWSSEPFEASRVASAAARVGAFPWQFGSRDAALLVTLEPGCFTAHVIGKDGTTGVALVEVYAADPAPVVQAFVASSDTIVPGGSTTLVWSVDGAETVEISPGIGVIAGNCTTVRPDTTTTYTLKASSTAESSASVAITIHVVSEGLPRIRVDRSGAVAVFRDPTGRRFIPRGVNYIRLDPIHGHGNFRSNIYDSGAIEAAFAALERDGYNIVRAFLSPDVSDSTEDDPLGVRYMDHFADFLLRATRHGIHLIPVFEWLPSSPKYATLCLPADSDFGGANAHVLHGPHITARATYAEDFVQALQRRVGPERMSAIFAYSLWNEMYLECSSPPFSSTTSVVTAANGHTYSMANPVQRQRAADEGVVHYAETVGAAIRSADPDAMVTIGLFSHLAVGKPGPEGLPTYPSWYDPRFPARLTSLMQTPALDFIDQHLYPLGSAYSLDADLRSIEWDLVPRSVPVILGEFGAFKQFFTTPGRAAEAMRDHQIALWHRGFGGYLFWTYDCAEQPELWTLLDGEGVINAVLAPINRPDPGVP